MDPKERKDRALMLAKARNYAEALPLLKAAVLDFPNNENLWQELVLNSAKAEGHAEAAEWAKEAVRRHPRSGWLWRQLGHELAEAEMFEDAERALTNARAVLGAEDEWVWRYYAALHKKRKNHEREIEAWEKIRALGVASSNDLNSLGIAYHDHKNFAKALEFYRLSAATEPSLAPLFNMGLVFNDPEVSQDADATDAYRRALAINLGLPRIDGQ